MKARPRYEPFIDFRRPSTATRRIERRSCALTNSILLLLVASAVVVLVLFHCVPQDSTAVLFAEPNSHRTLMLFKNKSRFNLTKTQAELLLLSIMKSKQNLEKPVWKKPVPRKPTGKKPDFGKPVPKKPFGKKQVLKKPIGKKPNWEKAAGKKQDSKKAVGKKPDSKKAVGKKLNKSIGMNTKRKGVTSNIVIEGERKKTNVPKQIQKDNGLARKTKIVKSIQ